MTPLQRAASELARSAFLDVASRSIPARHLAP
jgi:hypothetical protein